MRFIEEQDVLAGLLREWYDLIKEFTEEANAVFGEKAKQYDRVSPVWHRIEWPHGFVQELRKKTDRLSQLLDVFEGDVDTYKAVAVEEELRDIINYARMMAAIGRMLLDRAEAE